jgi:hypothetical protein
MLEPQDAASDFLQAGWDYLEDHSDIADLMQDVGGNFGSKATATRKDDGSPSAGRRDLNGENAAAISFAKSAKGATTFGPRWRHWHGMRSDRGAHDSGRTLSTKELSQLRLDKARSMALDRLGFTEQDMMILDKSGPCALRIRFDERIRQVVDDESGRATDLARALGWTISTSNKAGHGAWSQRMHKTLKRARRRRASGEVGEVECAADRCSNTFLRLNKSHLYCQDSCRMAQSRILKRAGFVLCDREGCDGEFRKEHDAHRFCGNACRKAQKKIELAAAQ